MTNVAELQALEAKATPAPWCYYNGDLWTGRAEDLAAYDADPTNWDDELVADHLFHGDPVRPEDAEFIAAARNAMPELLTSEARAARFAQLLANSAQGANDALSAVHNELHRIRGEIEALAAAWNAGGWTGHPATALLEILKPTHLGGEDHG